MAVHMRTTTVKGLYDHDTGRISETTKDGDFIVYNLADLLKEFDGFEIKITISEKRQIKAD